MVLGGKSAPGVFRRHGNDIMEKCKAILKIESYSSKDGMLILSVSDIGVKSMLKGIVDLCGKKHGGYIKAELSPPYPGRTVPQNSKWWAMCTEYGNYCGMTKDEVAIGVKCRAMEEGLWESEKVPFSKTGIMKPVSTAESDTRQMSVLIDVLCRIAAEDGYVFGG